MRDPFSIKLIALRDAIYEPTDDNVSPLRQRQLGKFPTKQQKKKRN